LASADRNPPAVASSEVTVILTSLSIATSSIHQLDHL
jgi:hypothetical protein